MNVVFCVNGYIGELPIQFLLDSGAAASVVNQNVVKQVNILISKNQALQIYM